jgi:hypothetical protein
MGEPKFDIPSLIAFFALTIAACISEYFREKQRERERERSN